MTRSKSKKTAPDQQPEQQPEQQPTHLKRDIRKDMRTTFMKQGRINKNDLISKYINKYPRQADQIRNVVTGYAEAIDEKAARGAANWGMSEKKQIETPKEPSPITPVDSPKPPKKKKSKAQKKSEPIQCFSGSENELYQNKSIAEIKQLKHEDQQNDSGLYEDPTSKKSTGKKPKRSIETKEVEPESAEVHADLVQSTNAILNEFKEHLATQRMNSEENNSLRMTKTPDLERQLQFLSLVDDNRSAPNEDSRSIEHAVLVSPILEDIGNTMPSQFGLLGHLASRQSEDLMDPRVMLNTNIPFSAFICGLQGSGKSHTTSSTENCSLPIPSLGILKKPLSTLVLHYNEYSSNVSNQPSEAAFLASTMPEFGGSYKKSIPVRVLTSPSNFHNLEKMYSQIPSVSVQPFRLQPRHLNIATMLSLMSMGKKDSMPLYMAQLTRVLREMALTNQGRFNYFEFRKRLKDLHLDRSQTPFLEQRLDLLDSFLDLKGADRTSGDYFVDGGVTILDLSCPFMDQDTACILFRIAIDLFLHAHPSRGKLIVADEAHKYMTNTQAANALTETFLNIIRQQRHLGTRIIISTQEPTISPRLIDLCSITIVHRFSSPEWYQTIKKHIAIGGKKGDSDQEGIDGNHATDGLYQISSLRTGEALVFAPSAYLLDAHHEAMDVKHRTFKMVIRKRITWDGGQTIKVVR
ncbi:hypothetical protein UA08_08679 [Talaromyces atroroseus]|uniref:Zona occludens toxin N-terminal domain-containing protein n=1 Tax=Talaromyces atroroseus TaxID=1441469 RepID=A0A225A894_TALAT|nr:hypothetical protein UA08_08679 [Talaromyces atroroseus]OKL56110.1 hypothetical protein UA08_08679 [Talaromyces atroroseus]